MADMATFKCKDEAGWAKALANNTDPYGRGVLTFAAAWAHAMEARMAAGAKLEDIAQATSREADSEGITGFMYGAAVSLLAAAWEHGEALRRWHNLDIQIGHEGEKANERGTVLNQALLNIG